MFKFLSAACAVINMMLASVGAYASDTGPWNVPNLDKVPEATWGKQDGLVQEVIYANEPFNGNPTEVFAYYGHPAGKGPFPGVVLVHGGGGRAFRDWVEHWVQRGYAAIAMDLAGNGASGRLEHGGPDQGDDVKFSTFTTDTLTNMWTYQAVAAVIHAHSLLRSRPEVDPNRIALTGISWGGYLTCIVAGLDHRFKAAVPVYGCGFLDQDSYWVGPNFSKMDNARKEMWVSTFDPSRYIGSTTCPILFVDGRHDFAYPPDSLRATYRLVHAPKAMSVKVDLPHGHIWTMMEVDTFIDSYLVGGKPLAKLGEAKIVKDHLVASISSPVPVTSAVLDYTSDQGAWQQRVWKNVPAEVTATSVSAPVPTDRPLACYLLVTDSRGLCVSTAYVDLPAVK